MYAKSGTLGRLAGRLFQILGSVGANEQLKACVDLQKTDGQTSDIDDHSCQICCFFGNRSVRYPGAFLWWQL